MKKIIAALDQIIDWVLHPVIHFVLVIFCLVKCAFTACPDEWCYDCFNTGYWTCLFIILLGLFIANLFGCFKKKIDDKFPDQEDTAE